MAKHYYTIEVVTSSLLEEEDIAEMEEAILRAVPAPSRVSTEYVDSEG